MSIRFEKPRASTPRSSLGVFLLFLSAFLLRLPYLVKYHYALNFDEAVIGIMAQDILSGKGIPLFFYGQNYFGPLEALFALPFHMIFPASAWALRTSIMILTFLALLFFWQGLRLFLRGKGGWIFLMWIALSPLVLTVRSIHPSGDMGGLFCGGTVFYLTARTLVSKDRSKALFFCWGLVSGLGLWMHPETLIYILAAGAMTLWRDFRLLRGNLSSWALGVPGMLIGGLPFWIKSVSLNFQTFHFGQPRLEHLSIGSFIGDLGRSLSHMSSFLGTDLFPLPLAAAGWAGILGLLAYSLFLFIGKRPAIAREEKAALLFAWSVMPLTLLAYNVIRAHRFGYISYRYYLPLLIGLGIIFQITLDRVGNRSPRLRTAGFLFLIFINLTTNLLGFHQEAYFRYQFNLKWPYIRWTTLPPYLNALGIDRAYVDLFAEGPLNFLFRNQKAFSDFYNSRYPNLSWEVDANLSPAFILSDPEEAHLFQQGLQAIGASNYSLTAAREYRIFHRIKAPETVFIPVDRKGIRITAQPHPDQAPHLLDGNLTTGWTTEGGQQGEEYLLLDFIRPQVLNRVDLVPSWLETYPVRLVIETSLDRRDWVKATDLKTSNTLFWTGPHPAYKVWEGFFQYVFPPRKARYLRIRQQGVSSAPWELAEIVLYAPGGKMKEKENVDWKALISFLKQQGIRQVVSDLYFSANILRRTEGEIRATTRFNPISSDPAFRKGIPVEALKGVAVHHREREGILTFLKDQGWTFRRQTFGDYDLMILLDHPFFRRKVLTDPEVTFQGEPNPLDAPFLTDKDPRTRWSSLTPRRPGMYLRCDFKTPQNLSGLILDPGPYVKDLPASLEIQYSLDGKEFQPIPALFRFYRHIRWTGSHLFGNDAAAVYLFTPLTVRSIKLTCREENQGLYWSVGELSFLVGGDRK